MTVMNHHDWILANLPEGAEILESCDRFDAIMMPTNYLVGCYPDRTTLSGSIPIAIVGSIWWDQLQAAKEFAERVERRRLLL